MLELRILTGLHRGAALPLEGDAIRIGNGAENDIVLLDPGMPPLACALHRTEDSGWSYRVYGAEPPNAESWDDDVTSTGTTLVAGARWFAGPVLMGCEDEGAPWPAETIPESRDRPAKVTRSFGRKLSAAALVAVVSAAAVALLRSPGALSGGGTADAAAAPRAPSRADTATGTVRVVSGTLYPSEAIRRPPFAIGSASEGAYGFVVTDDGQVLIPGSRWRSFTLVKIDTGRATFTGPYRAEIRW